VGDASSVDVTSGDRALVGPLLRRPADGGVGGVRRSARGMRTRGGRGRTAGALRNARGGSRIGRATVGKAGNLWTSNNESIDVVGPDVRPRESVVHSGEGGEFAGGCLISASVLHIDLDAAWIVLGLDRVKCNDLIANQVLPRGNPSGNGGSPFIAISDQLRRGPLSI